MPTRCWAAGAAAISEAHAETDHLVLTAHFPSPSIGYIRRQANAFRFHYVD